MDADDQVHLAATAATRKGVQPVATLQVNGGVSAAAAVGQTLTFSLQASVPSDAGAKV